MRNINLSDLDCDIMRSRGGNVIASWMNIIWRVLYSW